MNKKGSVAVFSWPEEDLIAKYGDNWHEAVFEIIRQQIRELGNNQETSPDP